MLNIHLALSLFRQSWLVDAATLAIGQRILAGEKADFEMKDDAYRIRLYSDSTSDGAPAEKNEKGSVAVFPICGTLYKDDSLCAYGTNTISRAIREAARNDQIVAGVLDINSGGGCIDAIPCMLQAIEDFKSTGKPLFVHAEYCCSAAYWIASAANRIYMDNPIASQVGSIGALYQVVERAPGDLEKDGYKIHTIYAEESPDKNKAYRAIQDGDDRPYKDDLTRTVSIFHAHVKQNRPNLSADAPGVLSGDVFYSDRALANGLADGVMTLEEVVAVAALDSKPNQSI